MTVQGLTAIVTGAGQGIGLEICKQLARRGARVILNDIDPELARQGAEAIRSENRVCVAVPGDASEQAVIDAMIRTAVEQFGQLDIAIANAGITQFGPFDSFSRASFQRVMEVNLAGTFFLAQLASRQMITQGSGGSLLFMSSVVGLQAHRDLACYAMSKAAVNMLAKNLVIELSAHGINVNTVAPGATLTERTLEDPNYVPSWSQLTPMGRPATVRDVADACVFLVSPESRHITGQCLTVDGGWTSISPNP
jgi:NAD(P)-dependent dehydrogenase (short-subunit alcohol dehydrogenase family)